MGGGQDGKEGIGRFFPKTDLAFFVACVAITLVALDRFLSILLLQLEADSKFETLIGS